MKPIEISKNVDIKEVVQFLSEHLSPAHTSDTERNRFIYYGKNWSISKSDDKFLLYMEMKYKYSPWFSKFMYNFVNV